jgi:hypothetical protein
MLIYAYPYGADVIKTELANRRSPVITPLVVCALWFTTAFVAGAAGAFERAEDDPPIRMALTAGPPVLGVGIALLVSPRFRAWAESLNLSLLINMQAWRIVGFSFLGLYAVDLLPGGFAFPAALGDVAVAVAAPFVAVYVARKGAQARPVFFSWTALGILDFIAAIALGASHSTTGSTAIAAPLIHLPMSLIPSFAVPFLFIVHMLSLARFSREDVTPLMR